MFKLYQIIIFILLIIISFQVSTTTDWSEITYFLERHQIASNVSYDNTQKITYSENSSQIFDNQFIYNTISLVSGYDVYLHYTNTEIEGAYILQAIIKNSGSNEILQEITVSNQVILKNSYVCQGSNENQIYIIYEDYQQPDILLGQLYSLDSFQPIKNLHKVLDLSNEESQEQIIITPVCQYNSIEQQMNVFLIANFDNIDIYVLFQEVNISEEMISDYNNDDIDIMDMQTIQSNTYSYINDIVTLNNNTKNIMINVQSYYKEEGLQTCNLNQAVSFLDDEQKEDTFYYEFDDQLEGGEGCNIEQLSRRELASGPPPVAVDEVDNFAKQRIDFNKDGGYSIINLYKSRDMNDYDNFAVRFQAYDELNQKLCEVYLDKHTISDSLQINLVDSDISIYQDEAIVTISYLSGNYPYLGIIVFKNNGEDACQLINKFNILQDNPDDENTEIKENDFYTQINSNIIGYDDGNICLKIDYLHFKGYQLNTVNSFDSNQINSFQINLSQNQNCNKFNKFLECIQCEQGYFLKENNCQKCSETCKECDSELVCTECPDNRKYLPYCCDILQFYDEVSSKCTNKTCEQNQYFDFKNNICVNLEERSFMVFNEEEQIYETQECDIKCLYCQDQLDNCTECNGQNRNLNQKCVCNENFEEQNNQCVSISLETNIIDTLQEQDKCNQSCEKCDAQNKCLECLQDYYLKQDGTCQQCFYYQDTCVEQCPDGQNYNDKTKICEDLSEEKAWNALYITLLSVSIILVIIILICVIVIYLKKKSQKNKVHNISQINQDQTEIKDNQLEKQKQQQKSFVSVTQDTINSNINILTQYNNNVSNNNIELQSEKIDINNE